MKLRSEYAGVAALVTSHALAETIVTLDTALSNCPPIGAVLPPPKRPSSSPIVQEVVAQLEQLQALAPLLLGNSTGLSLSVSSIYEDAPLLNLTYTPALRNATGTNVIDGDTVFRIASVSKLFTVLGLLMLGDKISMADPITKYVPELNTLKEQQEVQDAVTTVDWDVITLESLASHESGVGGSLGQDQADNSAMDLTQFGLPALGPEDHASCGSTPSLRPCEWEDFWNKFGEGYPAYAPFTTPAYSNPAFNILGLVIERVSNQSLAAYMQQHIFTPLNMTHTSFTKPSDSLGFIPAMQNAWSSLLGSSIAAGGLYSSTNDLHKFGRGIMNNKLLPEAVTKAWLKPRSHTSSLGIAIGAPWEIGRANNLTSDGRLVDLYTKTGGLAGYDSLFGLIPDYGLTVTILSSGEGSNLATQLTLATMVLQPLVRAVEAAGKAEVSTRFAGTYTNEATNSSITIGVDEQSGLNVTSWTMNGINFLEAYLAMISSTPIGGSSFLNVRLYPTGLESETQTSWRAIFGTTPPESVSLTDQLLILQLSCLSWNTGRSVIYGMRGLDEMVFELDGCTGAAKSVSPRAFRQSLTRT